MDNGRVRGTGHARDHLRVLADARHEGVSTKNAVASCSSDPCSAGYTVHHRVVSTPRGVSGPAMTPKPPHVSRMRVSTRVS